MLSLLLDCPSSEALSMDVLEVKKYIDGLT